MVLVRLVWPDIGPLHPKLAWNRLTLKSVKFCPISVRLRTNSFWASAELGQHWHRNDRPWPEVLTRDLARCLSSLGPFSAKFGAKSTNSGPISAKFGPPRDSGRDRFWNVDRDQACSARQRPPILAGLCLALCSVSSVSEEVRLAVTQPQSLRHTLQTGHILVGIHTRSGRLTGTRLGCGSGRTGR